jgi:hypothetical protein
MNDKALDEMMSNVRKHTMKRLLSLLDEATEAAYRGEVDEVRKATQEALFRIDMASETLFGLIANNYGADEAVHQKVENEEFKAKIKNGFCDKIVLAMHIRSAIEKGVPEA